MAEVLIGKALLSAGFKFLFDKMASREVIDFLKGRKRTEKLVEKLKTTMNSVEGVLDDAEEQQITKLAVKKWLCDLRDAFYQADDLLDKIAYEALRLKLETRSQATKRQVQKVVSSLNPFKMGMDEKLEEILERLEYLVDQKGKLGLREGVGEQPWLLSLRGDPTTSLLDKSGVYGRDADKAAIMELVLGDSNSVDVIRIVGMGGIGKTTLAQFVYGNSRVKKRFPLKSWVCISVEFDGCKVTKHIIKEFDNSVNCDNMTANQLHDELKNIVQKARFLLVLDDVWPDKGELFDFLWKPLQFGEAGSKIVVTTRNEWSRPPIMHRLRTHDIRALEEDACWSLFVKHAFGDENSAVPAELDVIGRKIVKKCKGLPLAIKVLGGLLSSNGNAKEWEMILENNMWNDHFNVERNILPALRLSYYYLPSPLKQCFAFCAIFPQDYEFQKEELILLWMAEGFIPHSQGIDTKQVGEGYFDDLVSRSFFQLSIGSSCDFVMHDLISDLAKSVSGEFCCRLEADCQVPITRRIRHLSIIKTELNALEESEAITSAAFLRTFLLKDVRAWWRRLNTVEVLLDQLPKPSCLRTVSLEYCKMSLVPDLVGHLKLLRYLNLKGALIKNLPDHVTNLYFLQTLILSRCWNLIKLPVGMARLINLCHLDITETRLPEMPPQMGKLIRLQCLTDFVLGNNSGSNIEELGRLEHLRGGLRIWNPQRVENAADALQANLKGKKHLQKLELMWYGDTKGSEHDTAVLGQLQPHTNLEVLTIAGYRGTRFPNWMVDSSLLNVVTLKLRGCKYCSTLPPIGQLSSLKDLRIEDFEAVEVIGPEFYGSNTSMKKPFGSLETLWFEGLPKWKEWKQLNNSGDEDESGVFPNLRKLSIKECHKVTKTLPAQLPSLEKLEIERSPEQLLCSIPRGGAPTFCNIIWTDGKHWQRDGYDHYDLFIFYVGFGVSRLNWEWASFFQSSHELLCFAAESVHCIGSAVERMGQMGYSSAIGEICIRNCGGLECFQLELFPNLITLSLMSCPDLKFISACEFLTSLTSLRVEYCRNFISFTEGRLTAPNLKSLSIGGLSNLKSLDFLNPQYLTSLEQLEIWNCPQIHSMPTEGLPSTLTSLRLSMLENMKSLDFLGAQYLTSLEQLNIHDCPQIHSMPTEGLPSTLTSLHLVLLPNLKSLDFLQYLTSLEQLEIWNCPQIHSMPTEGLPSTLTSLQLLMLPNLKSLDFLQYLTSLEQLKICNFPQIHLMPTEGLPSTLTSLQLSMLPNLKSLDCKGFQQLTSLKELNILSCPKLQCLPHEGLPSSLSSLSISKCPVLEQRCQRDKGEDWHKISYISKVEFHDRLTKMED